MIDILCGLSWLCKVTLCILKNVKFESTTDHQIGPILAAVYCLVANLISNCVKRKSSKFAFTLHGHKIITFHFVAPDLSGFMGYFIKLSIALRFQHVGVVHLETYIRVGLINQYVTRSTCKGNESHRDANWYGFSVFRTENLCKYGNTIYAIQSTDYEKKKKNDCRKRL